MRRASLLVVLIFLLVFTGACSTKENDPDRSSPRQEQLQDTAKPASAENEEPILESTSIELPPIDQVEDVAAALYQGLSDGSDLTGYIEEVYNALGIPVLDPETEFGLIETAIENQDPFALKPQMALIANALASGMHINLESFITEMNRNGFYALDTGGEVTLDFLSQNLSYLIDQNQYTPEENPIALVLALGNIRTGVLSEENLDPVWGDDLLDPLQSSLLWHLLDQVAANSQATALQPYQHSSHLSAMANPQRRGPLGDLLGSLEGAGAYLNNWCNNYRIFGHQSTLTLSEYQVYRITEDPKKPFLSQATFKVEYKYEPSTAADKINVQIGCPDLPPVGPRPEIEVDWELLPNGDKKPDLFDLGVLNPGEATNHQGVSEANYLANPEVVPTDLQQDMNTHYSDGKIRATAKLYPDNEIIMTIIATYPDRQDIESKYLGEAYLSVGYSTFPTIMWNREDGLINMEGIAWSCDGVNWVASHVFTQTLPGLTVSTSAEFSLTMPEFPLDGELKSNTIEVGFTGTWETPDGPVPVTDLREVWLSITEREITMNFEPIKATAIIKGNTVPIPFAFIFRSIPTEMEINTHCDGQ
jgi:hypothetical protein